MSAVEVGDWGKFEDGAGRERVRGSNADINCGAAPQHQILAEGGPLKIALDTRESGLFPQLLLTLSDFCKERLRPVGSSSFPGRP